MKQATWDSVEEMLAPQNLSDITGEKISSVYTRPADFTGYSGSHLSVLETNGGKGTRYILKHIVPAKDWVIHATKDTLGREVMLWQYGVMDKLKTVIQHSIIDCAKTKSGWALLKNDISDSLMKDRPMTIAQNQICIEGLADVHATFWQDSNLHSPELGLTTLEHSVTLMTPARCQHAKGLQFMVESILDGWERIDKVIAQDILAIVRQWFDNPKVLIDALQQYPMTLTHCDFWMLNVGIQIKAQKTRVIRLASCDSCSSGGGSDLVACCEYRLYTSNP